MKKAYFYIDDTIWVLRDITRQKPETLFENPFMNMLKTAHDKYGLKVQLNLFYRTDCFYGYDEFSLADVTDAYKNEFIANSDWIKFAFHAMQEFPDYPHVNATYDDTKRLFKMIEKEVFRFAGKDSFAYAVCPHWIPVSKEGVRALRDCGVKLLDCSAGDGREYDPQNDNLPYGHSFRLLNNRQPEAKVFTYPGASKDNICCYNVLPSRIDNSIHKTLKTYHNEEFDIEFKKFSCICLNTVKYDDLEQRLSKLTGDEYIGVIDHEQYFYPDYFAYQPDYKDKIFKTAKTLYDNGYEFIVGEDILKLTKKEN